MTKREATDLLKRYKSQLPGLETKLTGLESKYKEALFAVKKCRADIEVLTAQIKALK